ncbi:MAG: EAL domain-containing protein [Lachnospiraceae bacterium]|nr:EAL domain-containing protein [Lachnospiraceae bacterium]
MGHGTDSNRTGGRLSDLKHRSALVYVFLVFAIGLVILNGFIGRRFGNTVFKLGDVAIPISGLSGCIQSVSVVFCFLMVLTDYRKGIKLALFVLGFSFFGATRTILVTHSAASLPGVVNCVIHGVAAVLIYRQFKISDQMAVTDVTTRLTNRYGFERTLDKMLRHHERGYVVYMHVEGFHEVNANLGRRLGDSVVYEVGRRISEAVGKDGSVYKIEGAEFGMILDDNSNYTETVERVLESIEKPIEVRKDDITMSCFVMGYAGISAFTGRGETLDDVIICSDVAMNYAVNTEGVRICTYNDTLREQVKRVAEVEKLIKEGLENNYFYLQYQPQYVMEGKKLRGFEALVRMRLPDGSVISPGEFIPVAENSDLIIDIDRYVRHRAMREFKNICSRMDDDFTLSVNVSAKEISQPGFADEIMGMVRDIGFPPRNLEIEITEYSFAKSVDMTIDNINILRDFGIKIAVDDFGTGYTSLAQLLNLPVTLLKIDKSLIDNIENSEMNRDFVKTVIYMGHLMNCEVISEGVEKENQLKLLGEYECDFIQGFVWSRPLEYDAALGLCG